MAVGVAVGISGVWLGVGVASCGVGVTDGRKGGCEGARVNTAVTVGAGVAVSVGVGEPGLGVGSGSGVWDSQTHKTHNTHTRGSRKRGKSFLIFTKCSICGKHRLLHAVG